MPKQGGLDKPKTSALIIGWTVEGKTTREIAAMLAQRGIRATHQAVTGFHKRHKAEIDAITEKAIEAIEEATIASKAERLRRLGSLYDDMDKIRRERGLIATETKMIGSGPLATEVEVERFDAALVREMRGVMDDAAAEVGDRQRTPLVDQSDKRQVHFTINIKPGQDVIDAGNGD